MVCKATERLQDNKLCCCGIILWGLINQMRIISGAAVTDLTLTSNKIRHYAFEGIRDKELKFAGFAASLTKCMAGAALGRFLVTLGMTYSRDTPKRRRPSLFSGIWQFGGKIHYCVDRPPVFWASPTRLFIRVIPIIISRHSKQSAQCVWYHVDIILSS